MYPYNFHAITRKEQGKLFAFHLLIHTSKTIFDPKGKFDDTSHYSRSLSFTPSLRCTVKTLRVTGSRTRNLGLSRLTFYRSNFIYTHLTCDSQYVVNCLMNLWIRKEVTQHNTFISFITECRSSFSLF